MQEQYLTRLNLQRNPDKPKDFNLTLDYISLQDTLCYNTLVHARYQSNFVV